MKKSSPVTRDQVVDALRDLLQVPKKRLVRWAGLAVLLVLAAMSVQEALWRMHNYLDDSTPSPNEALVADIRNLPEGSALPYGEGVFLRSSWALSHRYQSDLVFAGHCRLLRVIWVSDARMRIGCSLSEGAPMPLKSESHGVAIEVKVFRR